MPTTENLLATTCGIELETSEQAGVNQDIREIQRHLDVYPGWKVKQDGSCGTRGSGPEVISPILRTEADLQVVDSVCRELDHLGYRTTPKCGFHVHLGASHWSPSQRDTFVQFMHQFEDFFFKLAPGRRESTYCKPIPDSFMSGVRAGHGWNSWTDRYHWVNGCAYALHTTVEIRLMSGSLNPRQVLGWVNLLLHTVTLTANPARFVGSLSWSKETGTDEELLQKFLAMARLTNADEHLDFNAGEQTRAALAREYLLQRWSDVRSDVNEQRAERKRRLHASWRTGAKFEPVFVTAPVTL